MPLEAALAASFLASELVRDAGYHAAGCGDGRFVPAFPSQQQR